MTGQSARVPPLYGLFQKRIAGDDSLLLLARLRFAQTGLGAEVYAGSEDELEWILGFVPEQRIPPMVHLSRSLDLLREDHRRLIARFATRFAGRICGLIVHDRTEMAVQSGEFTVGA